MALLVSGIKVIMDFVPNHTSTEHEWYEKSVKRIPPYTDYYVWKDAKYTSDGKRIPPNNWVSRPTLYDTPLKGKSSMLVKKNMQVIQEKLIS